MNGFGAVSCLRKLCGSLFLSGGSIRAGGGSDRAQDPMVFSMVVKGRIEGEKKRGGGEGDRVSEQSDRANEQSDRILQLKDGNSKQKDRHRSRMVLRLGSKLLRKVGKR